MSELAAPMLSPAGSGLLSLARAMATDDGALVALLIETLEAIDLSVAVKDMSTGLYVHAGARLTRLFGREPGAMAGLDDTALMDPGQAQVLRTADQAARAHTGVATSEHRFERDGRKREFRVSRVAVPRADGEAPRHVIGLWDEVTETNLREGQLKVALAQLEQQQLAVEQLRRESQEGSARDGVTGLFQRTHFEDQLRREVDLSSREHREFALVMISIDPLAEAAQTHGPQARVRVLEALGRLLRSNTRAMDASCRLDDDHFAVLLSGVGLATAHSRMEGLRRQCATQIVVLDGQDFGFSVSMGVASFPHTAHTQEELMTSTNLALAEAQRRGGNHVTLASIRFELE
jgi:diguanylate cyclase (GGDEF)-like protein